MPARKIIVVGASAGGVGALQTLVAALPAELQAAVCIVLHVGRQRSELPTILARAGPLPAVHAEDGMALEAGHIYVAPPDLHLLVADERLHLRRSPRENLARPAIDPLFRSAAAAYGANTCGVILTGLQNDGSPGLYELKQRGGMAIVQSPQEAQYSDMPRSALEHVDVDYCLPLAEIPSVLTRFAAAAAAAIPSSTEVPEEPMQQVDYDLERPVTLGCPDCGGALRRIKQGTLTQYRCHIGHTYTAATMARAQFADMERGIDTALRLINERAEMCRQMAESEDVTDAATRQMWQAARREAERRAEQMRRLLSSGWLAPEAKA
ncbi:MAG TPA: chemotaxis protein CheB [Salinisphaeraceae bacterium]|nr:chemotaxis protein CheB [Salinisphaeraceae bacterium]